jgi:hypothetical protein
MRSTLDWHIFLGDAGLGHHREHNCVEEPETGDSPRQGGHSYH